MKVLNKLSPSAVVSPVSRLDTSIASTEGR